QPRVADRTTRVSLAGAGASGVCPQARGLITINALSNSRAAVQAVVAALVQAGADVNARFVGSQAETPLHWAASCNDVAVIDALLDAGADLEAAGGVIGGGSPLADARGFGQWDAARRLVERGARTSLTDAATLGLMDRVEAHFSGTETPTGDAITRAFWGACHGGQRPPAEYLLARGADINWVGHGGMTPLDVASREDAERFVGRPAAADLVSWLHAQGAKSADDLRHPAGS
ncbi:MAG: ankyrin repeat domain-containing protein, partial [Acidobacteriota bacterium]